MELANHCCFFFLLPSVEEEHRPKLNMPLLWHWGSKCDSAERHGKCKCLWTKTWLSQLEPTRLTGTGVRFVPLKLRSLVVAYLFMARIFNESCASLPSLAESQKSPSRATSPNQISHHLNHPVTKTRLPQPVISSLYTTLN